MNKHNDEEIVCGTDLRFRDVFRFGVEQFCEASGDACMERAALCRYLKQGKGAGFSTGELVDWLGVSSPSILEESNNENSERILDMLEEITDQEIENAQIGPPRFLP